MTSHLPSQRQIDARSHRIEDKGFGKSSIPRKIGGTTGGTGGLGGFDRCLHVLHFHAKVKNSLAAVSRRKNRQIDVAVRKIDRAAVLGRFTASRDLAGPKEVL